MKVLNMMNVLHKSFGISKAINRNISYTSLLSLETLYPKSNMKLTTPVKQHTQENEAFNGYIPIEKLNISFSRSTGPGGQNVNKVNTKVDLRFHVQSASWLTNDIKTKLTEKLQDRITKEGYLVFRSDLTRSQQLNIADCLEKLRNLIRKCSAEKKELSPETEEKLRRRNELSARERLAMKRSRSSIKKDRQPPSVL